MSQILLDPATITVVLSAVGFLAAAWAAGNWALGGEAR